jgi:hypothetical protein
MTQADSVHSTPPLNTSSLTPIAGRDWLDIKEDASPADIFRAIGKLRKDARDEIERLIRFLDETDNHMELEDVDEDGEGEDAEPSLGSFDRMIDQSKAWQQRSLYPYPAVDSEHDNADDEPALGSLDHHHSQERWAAGGRRDLEEDLAESGIADFEGLYEQVGTQDWAQGGMG